MGGAEVGNSRAYYTAIKPERPQHGTNGKRRIGQRSPQIKITICNCEIHAVGLIQERTPGAVTPQQISDAPKSLEEPAMREIIVCPAPDPNGRYGPKALPFAWDQKLRTGRALCEPR